jgi:hypothetical protein
MLTFKTLKEVAENNNISERTLRKLRSTPEFQAIYAAIRSAAYERAFDLVCSVSFDSVNALVEIMKDKTLPASSRGSAARALLELAYKHNEDIDRMRIDALEEYVKRLDKG